MSMKTHDIAEIVKSVPVNRTARNVISKGTHYEPVAKNPETESWFADCPPLFDLSSRYAHTLRSNPDWKDLTGNRYGNVTVVGLSAEKLNRWVCRCVCGRFVMRKASAIKKQTESMRPNMCTICNNAHRVRDGLPSYLGA
jgi:hypothetical protein